MASREVRRPVAALCAAAAVGTTISCAAILGIDTASYADGDAGDANPSGPDTSASGADASASDVGADAGDALVTPPDAKADGPRAVCEAGVVDFGCNSDAGLVAYWRLDEGMGATVADCQGSNHGLLSTLDGGTPPAWTAGHSGNALSFSGTSFVEFGEQGDLSFSGAMSVSAWVNATSGATERELVIGAILASGPTWSLTLGSANSPAFTVQSAIDFSRTMASDGPLPPGTWHHVAGVFRPGVAVEVWVDGARAALIGADAGPLDTPSGNVRMGGDPGFPFFGVIDEVRVFSRALDPCEIAQLETQ